MIHLITGLPGTGKTRLARAFGYLLSTKETVDCWSEDLADSVSDVAVNRFIESDRCLYIQAHPSLHFQDLVYGTVFDGGLSMPQEGPKAIPRIIDRASHSTENYVVIIDDIDRAEISELLGPLASALGVANCPVRLSESLEVRVPENLSFIFTYNVGNRSTDISISLLTKMDVVTELLPSANVLERYYSGNQYLSVAELAVALFSHTNDFLSKASDSDGPSLDSGYGIGHGYFIVPLVGTESHIRRSVLLKYQHQVTPHLHQMWRDGLLKNDPSVYLNSLAQDFSLDETFKNEISGIEKIFLNSRDPVDTFSCEDSHDYIKENIVNKGLDEHRMVVEGIIDAILTNGALPPEVGFTYLLNNTNVGWVGNERRPGEKAAFVLSEELADEFVYTTPKRDNSGRRVVHKYYSKDKPRNGRWKCHGAVGYRFTYSNNASENVFIPVNGVRLHTFNVSDSKIYKENNPVEIYECCYALVSAYVGLYLTCLRAEGVSTIEEYALDNYLSLESSYLRALHQEVSSISGEKPKFKHFCKGLLLIKSLWTKSTCSMNVDKDCFESLCSGNIALSTDNIVRLHERSTNKLSITFKEVGHMGSTTNYQSIMDSLGVKQLIFQGPPGTSKTFDAKRFVLQQLNPNAECLKQDCPSRDEIERELDAFKATSEDYSNPSDSGLLNTGGWDIVQFHPAYSYEDFIRGISVSVQNGAPVYETVNKIFGKIAKLSGESSKAAKGEPAKKFYLVIDEINRADLASVFGELIYGLEYRGSKMSTPYSIRTNNGQMESSEMAVSGNLYLVGTMNTADKSIGSLDYAIRRRFLFVDCPARREVVSAVCSAANSSESDYIELLLFDSVQAIFDSSDFFNGDYHRNDVRLGHTYFLRSNKDDYKDVIAYRIAYQVVPIIREYIRDGILSSVDDESFAEHSADEIKQAYDDSRERSISLIAENFMLYASLFGERTKNTKRVDAEYVCDFVYKIITEFSF